jgi:hypothetical protein
MFRFYTSIKNNLIIDIVIKKLLWSENRAHLVEFGVTRHQTAALFSAHGDCITSFSDRICLSQNFQNHETCHI